MSGSPHPPTRILKVYTEALIGFIQVFSPDGLNNTLFLQSYVLRIAPTVGMMVGTYLPRTGEGVRIV